MTITNGYCTAQELRIEVKRANESTTITTNILELAINRASRYIDRITGRIWYGVTLTDHYVDIYGQSLSGLLINSIRDKIVAPCPLLTVTALVEDGVTLTVNDDYYLFLGDGYIIKDGMGEWSSEHRGVKITGTMGYAATPDHIKHYCLAIASAISGLSAQILNDENGDAVAVIRNHIPSWVTNALKAERRLIVL